MIGGIAAVLHGSAPATFDLDVLRTPAGAPRYDVLAKRAERVEIGGDEILVASVEDLMAMKAAAGRPKDQADLVELEAILRLRKA